MPNSPTQSLREAMRQRFHEVVLARLDESDGPLADGLVVEGVGDRIGLGRTGAVAGHLQVDDHGLAYLALPIVDADDGVYPQAGNENLVSRH